MPFETNQRREEKAAASRLITSLDEMLAALPSEETRGDDRWEEQPVKLETWLYAPEFMNLDITLSPRQIEVLEAMDDPNTETNRFTEFVIEWGKGSGKDFICALAALRQVYFLLCMKNPYEYYGLAKNTGIQLVNVAYTRDQAQYVYLKQVKGLLKGSPWFMRRYNSVTRTRVTFKHDIELVSTSADGDSAEGQNIFFAVMDEASAFKDSNTVKAAKRADGVKADRAADSIYKVLRTSSRSRFPRIGKVVMISYPRYRDDFIQTMRKYNEKSEEGWTSGPYATWDVNPRVKEADFKEDFDKNPEQARAMYMCDPPYAEDGYVSLPHRFIECIINSKKMGLESPLDENGAYSPFFKGLPGRFYAIHVDLALRKDRCVMALARQGEPVMREKCPCNKFNFPGTEICLACGRPRDRWLRQELPTMVVTLLKVFEPKQNAAGNREVDFADVREEIMWLRDRGHNLWALSYDGWQSVDSVQTMSKVLGQRSIKDRWNRTKERHEEIVSTISVDRNTEAHDTLKEFIYDERFFIAPPRDVKDAEDWDTSQDPVAIAFREWRSLRLINAKKIDHPIGGSKDAVDALAGCAWHIAKMPIIRLKTPIITGWNEESQTKPHAATH